MRYEVYDVVMDTILIAQRKQRLVWGAATLLIALVGLAQRDQRGLLSGPDVPMTASAFAAITPQAPGMSVAGDGTGTGTGGPGNRQGLRRLVGQTNGPGNPQLATGGPSPLVGSGPSVFDQPLDDAQPATTTPSALLALADPGSGGGINAGPGSGGGSGLPTISPGGPQQTVSGAVPGAVPEAPMWAIMILGVGGIGCMARRERARGRALLKTQVA